MKTAEAKHIEFAHALAQQWFAEHQAKLIPRTMPDVLECQLCVIDWRRPGRTDYGMHYIITQNVVIVTGDVGDAVYGFTNPPTFEAILHFDWHYFVNKCVASETGRNYVQKIPGVREPVVNVRAIAHHVGLQMAIKQLLKEGK